ncbi:hypothetical protein B0H14DRAFT_3123674 [Mycena olivaceomarginata]|nr:hypothetical protein B0H14DRAFT_3123674 [Mycena olivaceomarginata]
MYYGLKLMSVFSALRSFMSMTVPETSFVKMMSQLKNKNKSDTVIERKVGLINERHSGMCIGFEQAPVDVIVIGAIKDLELVIFLFAQNTNILDIHCLQHKHCDPQHELHTVEELHGDSMQPWKDSAVLRGTPVFIEHMWCAQMRCWVGGLGAAGAVVFGGGLAAPAFPWDTTDLSVVGRMLPFCHLTRQNGRQNGSIQPALAECGRIGL